MFNFNLRSKIRLSLFTVVVFLMQSLQMMSAQSFHDTKGNIEVNGAGQLAYTLPVALPPGVKSVAPQINLTYSSGATNGIAGYGWNLSGLTSISRGTKTVEIDGEAKGVQMDYSDYYTFNGQRLILKSGEYGKNGAEYVTEKYSNIKIKSVGTDWNSIGPIYWEVTFEDGSRAWYGNNPLARTYLEYNITKWMDAQGNYISYSYSQNYNVAYISSIEWGGNEILDRPHFNRIDFTYTSRGLIEDSYVGGLRFLQNNLLSEIRVNGNGEQFKKYVINYLTNGTNYQLVDKITEYNAANESATPASFSYPTPVQPFLEFSNNNVDSFENVKLTGDFNGDSYLDFVLNNGVVKLGGLNDTFSDISTGKVFNSEAKVVHSLLDEEGQVYNGNGIVQYEAGKVTAYILRNNSFVKIFEKSIYDPSTCTPQPGGTGCSTTLSIFNEGDINGDGISDVFVSLKQRICQFVGIPGCNDTGYDTTVARDGGEGIIRPPLCQQLECNSFVLANYIVDLKNPSNPLATYSLDTGINENSYTNQQYFDMDGDGKVDIINVSNSNFTVFEFVKSLPNEYLKKIKFSGNLAENKASEYPVLFGDYNGDGNLDFAVPTTESKDKDNWRFYIGTEKGFSNYLKTDFLKYRKPNDYNNSQYPTFNIYRHYYSVSDINKDGKSDIIHIYSFNKAGQVNSSGMILNRYFGYNISTYIANGTLLTGGPDFYTGGNFGGTNYVTFNVGEFTLFSPITSQVKINNNYYDALLFWKERMHKLRSPSSSGRSARVQSIVQGGITTYADYLEVIPDNPANLNFYQKLKKEYYPYFSLNRVDQSYAVSQLRQNGRKQDFRYRGMTGHLNGRGMIGYQQSARSSWYADGFENTIIWSGIEIDPLLNGLPVKEWNIRTNTENNIFPANLTAGNTQLLNLKTTIYDTYKLLNGQVVTALISDSDKPKIVTANVVKNTTSMDFTSSTLTQNVTTYGDYYLPQQSITTINNNYAVSTSDYEYVHNLSGVGADYYVGRPVVKTDVIQAYGDSRSAKSEFTYENNLLKTLTSWNRDNTGYIRETYSYDGFGNITQKTATNSVDSHTRTEINQYEPQGRFVEKKTGNLGLETLIEYNKWGQIKKQTEPSGNTLTNIYDDWGKLLSATSSLGGTTSYQYLRDSNYNVVVTQNGPDGNISKRFTDRLGQDYKVSTKAFNQGQYTSKDVQYDSVGRKIAESEPYFEGQSVLNWNTINYDDSVLPLLKVTATSFNGKVVETTIAGLTTTATELNGYGRITTKTADALGNIISTNDAGGTIHFSYNASGEQIRAKYAENIVATKYDVWGRRSELDDPSNGVYSYEYNGFGQTKKVISPKGTRDYNYNLLGQLTSQTELSSNGISTIKNINFSYDALGRLTLKSGVSNGQPYSVNFEFDTYGRLKSSTENSNGRTYAQKGYFYDGLSRIKSYTKSLSSSGITTEVTIIHDYNSWNGELYQLRDKKTGYLLWELQSTNERGQDLNSKLGEASIANTYDGNGFLSNINHSSAVKPGILQISYLFDAVKNELKSRTTGGDFNINESFDYDSNNRLVNWTDPVSGIKPPVNRNTYDIKGRITENDDVGVIKFENSSKIYQPTGITLSTSGTQNYNNDLLQVITYNENNDPVLIDGVKADAAFEYGLTSMRQKVSYGSNFTSPKEAKFIRLYNEDGSFEVTVDTKTKGEKHILYIGGTPYESNIIYLKNFKETAGSYKFLHKDYLGSVLAISDEAGKKLEQRHFDAWGNFTHLQLNASNIVIGKTAVEQTVAKYGLITDRGYTSHEHFLELGIIHMNGRLYDPLLRRFLNADEHIQDSENTQNYNKYSYVLNNPLMFNDPSGEFIQFLAIPIVKALVFAVVSYTATVLITGAKFNILNLYSTIVMSLISAGITNVVGDVFSTATASVGNEALKSLVHAGVQGTLSFMQGGNFLSAAASAFLASFASYGYGKFIGNAANTGGGQVAFGMISGGVGSALTGGNFWDGVKIGGIVSLFNHYSHRMSDPLAKDKPKEDSSIMKIMKENSPVGIFGTDPESIVINPVGINYVAGINDIHDSFYFLNEVGVGKASFRTTRTLYMSITIRHAALPTNAQKIFAEAIDAGLDALSTAVKLREGRINAFEMDLLLKNTIDLFLRSEKGTSSFQAPFNSAKRFIYSNWKGSWF